MLSIIIGKKGTGKTKRLIEQVEQAEANTSGSVVFINKGDRHIFDVSHRVRLVDTKEFDVDTYRSLYGLVCGMISQNYDISDVFIDSVTKIAGEDSAMLEQFLSELDAVAAKFNINAVVFISMDVDDAPEGVKKYVK